MTICQIIYDISFFFIPLAVLRDEFYIIVDLLSTFGGLSTTLWTNVLSYIVLYVVTQIKSFDTKSSLKKFAITISLFSSLFAILSCLNIQRADRHIFTAYFWIKIFSILFNMVAYIAINYRLSRISSLSTSRYFFEKIHCRFRLFHFTISLYPLFIVQMVEMTFQTLSTFSLQD